MKFLSKFLIFTLFFAPLSTTTILAQPSSVKATATDSKANTLLDKVKKQYNGYTSLESKFKLEFKLLLKGNLIY